jgi:hypothetical protein
LSYSFSNTSVKTRTRLIYGGSIIVVILLAIQTWAFFEVNARADDAISDVNKLSRALKNIAAANAQGNQEDRVFRDQVRRLIACGRDQSCIESLIREIRGSTTVPIPITTTTTTTTTILHPTTTNHGTALPRAPTPTAGQEPTTTTAFPNAPPQTTSTTALLPPVTLPCLQKLGVCDKHANNHHLRIS